MQLQYNNILNYRVTPPLRHSTAKVKTKLFCRMYYKITFKTVIH